MPTLARELRKDLEKTVKQARRVAEAGARKAVAQLGVGEAEAPKHLSADQRALRNRLRAHGRQLGDRRDTKTGTQDAAHLVQECAYEHWHRMLFARFLAETDLLIEPVSGVAITLDEVQELAREKSTDWLELASNYAERMLPQIFRKGDPVLDITLPPETWSDLEDLLKKLRRDVFLADDSLGWVYQFWQADRKDEVNRSEKKIGADELPAVTQLFTEDYMVLFLLHNTLGAWWAGKVLSSKPELAASAKNENELRSACKVGDIDWAFLRFVRDAGEDGAEGSWQSAAGTFEGWPKEAKDITVLDPCMGSGHFLVFAFPILVAFRMTEENLSREAATVAVLRDNLFGLEIDSRCTQIAAFNLAFAVWRMVGYRSLPRLNLACSGLALGVTKSEWLKLAERAAAAAPVPPKRDLLGSDDNLFSARIKNGIERLYDLFVRAPWLGSLINPRQVAGDVFAADFVQLEPVLTPILTSAGGDEVSEMAVAAQGMTKAAELLGRRFTLVTTNVPYLGRGKQDDVLRGYSESRYPSAKADIATCFVERCISFSSPGGTAAIVTPQNWLFLSTYKKLREQLLRAIKWTVLARLGSGAFETISGEVVSVALLVLDEKKFSESSAIAGIDTADMPDPFQKARELASGQVSFVRQEDQLKNPDSRVTFHVHSDVELLSARCSSFTGLGTGDYSHYGRRFWEFPKEDRGWTFQQCTVEASRLWGGREHIVAWDHHTNRVRGMTKAEREQIHNQDQSGQQAWGQVGVAVGTMGSLPVTIYTGERHEKALAALIPQSPEQLPALWCLCSSPEFSRLVRQLDRKQIVTNVTLIKIPFDATHWNEIAVKEYPNGLPKPYSDDPTQWLFHGNPRSASHPIQVAVARLVGYQWPRQTGSNFVDSPSLGPDGLEKHADVDGIVCLTALKGEQPAEQRLNALFVDTFGADWSAAKLADFLAETGFARKSLDEWLRDGFFVQHCELFHQRPFVWHVWDGRRDGFHALVNYHRLAARNGEGRQVLEKLIYTYLGDWIDRQRVDQKAGVEGADDRLAAAKHLSSELTKILEGEPPYDIFVRWKPLHEQPIGWEPDINDGVRMNIRPFMSARPLGARGANACILRTTPTSLKWGKDRGKEPTREKADYPWFWGWDEASQDFAGGRDFDGNRWNDLHYSRAVKQIARDLYRAQGEKKSGGKK